MLKARSAQQLGQVIQSYRLKAGLTQLQLAELAGTGQKTISKIETGNPATRIETIFSVMAALSLEANIHSRGNDKSDNMKQNIADLM